MDVPDQMREKPNGFAVARDTPRNFGFSFGGLAFSCFTI